MIRCADLFCGAGGFTAGLVAAIRESGIADTEMDLIAVNHWDIAIETHSANHPGARHYHSALDALDPRAVAPGGKLDLLLASPECTHHSRARGGKPMSDQSRSSAWCILRWLDALDVAHVLIENVPEFETWGPLHPDDHPDEARRGRPVEAQKGKYFRNFVRNLRALGYRVDHRVLDSAAYGDATTRRRLFIQARKAGRVRWPEPTHAAPAPDGAQGALAVDTLRPWRCAREIINWDLPGQSIYRRSRPLAPNTLKRIYAGLGRFGVAPQQSVGDSPVPTEPYLVVLRNHCDARTLDSPAPALTTSGAHLALAQPYIVPFYSERTGQAPRVGSLDHPLGTVTTQNRFGLAEPYLVAVNHGEDLRVRSLDQVLATLTAKGSWALCEPYLVRYHGTDTGGLEIGRPLPTVDTRDRYGLVSPEIVRASGSDAVIGWLDIRFRMLHPTELAAAMGFPDDYRFVGTRAHQVRQIGNAVPVRLAAALTRAALFGRSGAHK